MGKLSGKIIEASAAATANDALSVGSELRKLRILSGLTQAEIAKSMGVRQAAVSKIENGGEMLLSTVQRYVEALGASLRVDAQFPLDTPLSLLLNESFEEDGGRGEQLLLPLLGHEVVRPPRDVVLSIKPFYSEEILSRRKTVELRRRFPASTRRDATAYIYATSPVMAIVGTAKISDVRKLPINDLWSEFSGSASIDRGQFDSYFRGLDDGFALLLHDAQEFSRPYPLTELRKRFEFKPPQSFLYAKEDLVEALKNEQTVVSN